MAVRTQACRLSCGSTTAGTLAYAQAGVNRPRSTPHKLIQFLLDVVESAASTALLSSHIVTGIQDAAIGSPFGAPAIGS